MQEYSEKQVMVDRGHKSVERLCEFTEVHMRGERCKVYPCQSRSHED